MCSTKKVRQSCSATRFTGKKNSCLRAQNSRVASWLADDGEAVVRHGAIRLLVLLWRVQLHQHGGTVCDRCPAAGHPGCQAQSQFAVCMLFGVARNCLWMRQFNSALVDHRVITHQYNPAITHIYTLTGTHSCLLILNHQICFWGKRYPFEWVMRILYHHESGVSFYTCVQSFSKKHKALTATDHSIHPTYLLLQLCGSCWSTRQSQIPLSACRDDGAWLWSHRRNHSVFRRIPVSQIAFQENCESVQAGQQAAVSAGTHLNCSVCWSGRKSGRKSFRGFSLEFAGSSPSVAMDKTVC